jgi:hypothetical protein
MSRSTVNTPDVPGLPLMPVKPAPREIEFRGCPPEGSGGDRQLNLLKNRIDDGPYIPVELATLKRLSWPATVAQLPRRLWSSEDAQSVAKYEGIPLSVEGYLAGAREQGPESTNCRSEDPQMLDFHLWLVGSPDEDRSTSIVVEVTPRIRASQPDWDIELLQSLVHTPEKVRISGWLMLDQEHPDQIGKTRGTLWEIHPIMKIDVMRSGDWASLAGKVSR